MIFCRMICALAIFGVGFANLPVAFAQSASAEGRFEHRWFASISQGDEVFVFGGLLAFPGNTRRFTANYRLNLANGTTTSLSSDMAFSDGNAAALWQGVVYVSGGSALNYHDLGGGAHATGYSDAFGAYDIANDRWVRLHDMPTTALGQCSFANDGSVYIVGGIQKGPIWLFRSPYLAATRVLRFSIATANWSWMDVPSGALAGGGQRVPA